MVGKFYQSSDNNREIAVLEKIKQQLKSMQHSGKDTTVEAQMKQFEEILAIERNQGSTIKTMERLIKQSKRHQ
jgi:uncharacterized protein YbaP (TraB family)